MKKKKNKYPNYFMNIFLNSILFFELFFKIFALHETDIGKYDWQIRNLGDIKEIYLLKQKRLALLNEKIPTFAILLNGIENILIENLIYF